MLQDDQKRKILIILHVADFLESVVLQFSDKIGPPEWERGEGGAYPRYKNPTLFHFQLLMAVRVVSGINACCHLLEHGYVQETGVILRTIDEFLSKITCIHEFHENKKISPVHKKIVDEYFKIDIRSRGDLGKIKGFWLSMRKVISSASRFICSGTKGADVAKFADMAETIHDGLSGYTHGFYSHVMEIYDGHEKKFQMKGDVNSRRVDEMLGRGALAAYVHRSANIFALIAKELEMPGLFSELIKIRKEFETSEAYFGRNV